MKSLLIIILTLYLGKHFFEQIFSIDIYPIVLALYLMILIFSISRKFINADFLLYFFLMLVSFLITSLINQEIRNNYLNLIFLYIVQPAALFGMFIALPKIKRISYANFGLKLISFSTYLTLLGAVYFYLVHSAGFPDPYEVFSIEFTSVSQSIVIRNPSFMGLSLVFCGVALIQFLTSKYYYSINSKYVYNFNAYLALISIGLSLSRRAMLPVIIYYIFTIIFGSQNTRLKSLMFFIIFLVSFSVMFPDYLSIISTRVLSIFDIVNDSSNVSRIKLMGQGLTDILLRPWGTGFGSLSGVGYTNTEVWDLENVRVTESTIITITGEIGLFFMVILLFLMLKYLNHISKKSILLFIIPIFIECVVGLGLLSPIVSFFTILFLISLYTLETRKDPIQA